MIPQYDRCRYFIKYYFFRADTRSISKQNLTRIARYPSGKPQLFGKTKKTCSFHRRDLKQTVSRNMIILIIQEISRSTNWNLREKNEKNKSKQKLLSNNLQPNIFEIEK